jgi:uncharacterized membrane protein
MSSIYNKIAGSSLERISALSDGVFAIAMTLIVLELKVPGYAAAPSEFELLRTLKHTSPHFATYVMSFLTLAIFWHGQQAQLNSLARSNRDFSMIHMAFLAAVAILPFSTSLLGEHITLRIALLIYWLNLALLGLPLYAGWRYAKRAKLVREDLPPEMAQAVEQRIARAQGLYLFGAALCFVSTYLSIGFIVLVQLLYAIGPRSRLLNRITR